MNTKALVKMTNAALIESVAAAGVWAANADDPANPSESFTSLDSLDGLEIKAS